MIIPVPSTRVTAPTTDTAARVGKLLSFTSHPVMIINMKHVKNESTASAVISKLPSASNRTCYSFIKKGFPQRDCLAIFFNLTLTEKLNKIDTRPDSSGKNLSWTAEAITKMELTMRTPK